MDRRITVAIAAAILVAFVGWRVTDVNLNRLSFPVEEYRLGDEVSLNGSFAEYSYENTDGYVVRVVGVDRMSISKYLLECSKSDELSADYLSSGSSSTDVDAPTLLVVDLVMTNHKGSGDERGYLDSIGWSIRDDSHPWRWIRVDSALLQCTLPQLDGAYQLSIKPGTSYSMRVPFSAEQDEVELFRSDSMWKCPDMESGEYGLILTKDPTRKVVRFSVE